jgi:hypothetical protein
MHRQRDSEAVLSNVEIARQDELHGAIMARHAAAVEVGQQPRLLLQQAKASAQPRLKPDRTRQLAR